MTNRIKWKNEETEHTFFFFPEIKNCGFLLDLANTVYENKQNK